MTSTETPRARLSSHRSVRDARVAAICAVALALASTPPGIAQTPTPAATPVVVARLFAPEKALRFDVTVHGSIDDVWTAFTTAPGLSTWLWRDTRVDLRPGGDWLAIFPASTAGGTILSFVPKRQLVVSAMAPETFPTVRATRTRAQFDFVPITPNSTRVTLLQTGWQTGTEWDAAYEYLAGGNAELLMQLYQRFATGPIAWPKG
jgi:uncharacterized protein YndB with AHSA1/START domain